MAARAAEIQRTMRRALPRVGQAGKRSRPWGSRNNTGHRFPAETQRRRDKRREDKAGWKEGAAWLRDGIVDGQAGRPVLQNVGIGDLQAADDVDWGDDGDGLN